MSTRILILKDGVITPSRNSTDTNSIVTSLGLTKSSVGLNLVDNTSDLSKPISTTTQTALDLKANLISPALSGTPTAPTAIPGTNTTQIASTAFVSTAISNLVSSSPAALDTLNELATALGNDPNFATTITNSLALKAPLISPSFTTPNLGTPSAGILTNATGLPLIAGTTGTLTISRGGTGATTQQAAIDALVGTQTANRVLRSNGTNILLAQIGLTTDVTGILPIANGGTGSSTQNWVDITSTQTGIAGNKTFTGILNISNSIASTSTTTGALTVSGGVGISGNIHSGNLVYSNGGMVITGTNPDELGAGYGFIRHSSGPLLFFIGTTSPFYFKKGDGGAGGLIAINQDATISYLQTIPTGSGTTCVFSGGKIIALSSSREVKENIRQLEVREDILELIDPVTFNYKGQDPIERVAHGFIVEDLEAVEPSLVTYEEGKAYSVQHSELVAVLWSEVKKLKKLYANNNH